jgi:hypothetical protein
MLVFPSQRSLTFKMEHIGFLARTAFPCQFLRASPVPMFLNKNH